AMAWDKRHQITFFKISVMSWNVYFELCFCVCQRLLNLSIKTILIPFSSHKFWLHFSRL
ncbi:hypothetical protein L9F63_025124, partial [Diploptera punctata]